MSFCGSAASIEKSFIRAVSQLEECIDTMLQDGLVAAVLPKSGVPLSSTRASR